MWVWITFFLITFGIGAIGFSASTSMTVMGAIAFITGVITMIFSMEEVE